jgi:hypothetical protein
MPAFPPTSDGRLLPGPEKVLKAQQRCGIWHLPVQRAGLSEEEATWEKLDKFRQQFPDVRASSLATLPSTHTTSTLDLVEP